MRVGWPATLTVWKGLAIGLMRASVLSDPIDVARLTLRQRRTDPHELGRLIAISMS
jgi:hypothetical protein